MLKIHLTSIFVNDQAEALQFYTEKLGFDKLADEPLGEHRWLTVAPPNQADGMQLLLEPSAHAAVPPFKQALLEDSIPFASFAVDDIDAEFQRLIGLGVVFTQEPITAGGATTAVFDDTCGNLIQLVQVD